MFYIAINKIQLEKAFCRALKEQGTPYRVIQLGKLSSQAKLEALKRNPTKKALITCQKNPALDHKEWIKILKKFSQSYPVFLADKNGSRQSQQKIKTFLTRALTKVKKETSDKKNLRILKESHIASRLKIQKSLSVISLNLELFESIKENYGEKDYNKIYALIKKSLLNSWGKKNFFRKEDLLLRDKEQKNLFYILLSPSRDGHPILKPGKIHEIALRIEKSLEKTLWNAFESREKNSKVPSYLSLIPHIIVGYSTTLAHPGKDTNSFFLELKEQAKERARLRDKERNQEEKEILHYLIANSGIISAHFQGIFQTSKIKYIGDSLSKNKKALYAAEALMRVDQKSLREELSTNIRGFMNLSYISPEPLFQLAKKQSLELELDYKGIKEALNFGKNLNTILFINILPRNLYLIDSIRKICPKNQKLVFEISETEAIKNIGLVKDLRKKIKGSPHSIAIDDFGRGHSNFERILDLDPEIIKLDRMLIQNIHKSKVKQKVIQTLVQSLNKKTLILAEGVEIEEEFKVIKELGVHLVQGYLFHRPSETTKFKKEKKSAKLS